MTVLASAGPAAAQFTPRRIGVIGAGWLGGTVGRAWAKAGHRVLFSSRHPEELTASLGGLGDTATTGYPADAAKFGEILLFAVPFDALPQLGRDLHDDIAGKIVLDACNAAPNGALTAEAQAKGVAETSAAYLPGTRLVRAFSAVDATAVEASGARSTGRLGVPLASDDAAAMEVAAQLVRDAGCEPVIVGDLASARAFQRGGPGFRANTGAADLRRRLQLPQDR